MRILEGSRQLEHIEIHLTDAEVEQVKEALAECQHDLAEVGLPVSHVPIGDRTSEVMLYVYATQAELESEVADRLSDTT